MSGFYIERKVQKTRNDHKCMGCCETILKGEPASNIVWTNDDGFSACYICDPCRDYLDRNPGEAGDEWGEGDVGDARRE